MSVDDVDIRVRLRGGKIAAAEAQGVAASVESIGAAGSRSQAHLSRLKTSVDGLNGPLRSIGGAAKIGALGLGIFAGAAAGAVGFLGFQFNRTMDSQRVAFTTFMRDGDKAAKFMGELRQLALESPVLDPKSTGEAARMLMAYGVAVKDVLPMVKAVGDMSAASGKSIAEVMPRAAMAIGQVASKGKLQAEELNQLAESVGLSRGRIRKALGMTRGEFEDSFKPGKGITAAKALPAIQKAMEAQSKGAADMLAKTTSGQMDRLKEVISQKAGSITRGIWDGLGDAAGGLADKLQKINFRGILKHSLKDLRGGFSAGQKGQNLGLFGFDPMTIGNVLGRAFRLVKSLLDKVKPAWADFMEAIKPAEPFFKNVLGPLLKGFAIGVLGSVIGALKVVWPLFKALMVVLGYVGQKLAPLKGVFQGVGMVLGIVLSGAVLKVVGLFSKLPSVFGWVGKAAKLLSLPVRFVTGMFGKLLGVVGRIPGLFSGALGKARGFIESKLIDVVAKLPGKFAEWGLKAAEALVKGVAKIPGMLRSLFSKGLGFAANIGRAFADWLNDATPLGDKVNLPSPLPDFRLPALANGGTLTSMGAVLVGERGPEMLRLPKGARVDPLPKHGPMASAGAATAAIDRRPVYLMVNGRVMAEAVGRDTRDRVNRR